MNFFNMNFSMLFLEKHGKKKFNRIHKQITKEKNNINDNYIEVLFKVSYLDFFGLDNISINKMIKDIMRY